MTASVQDEKRNSGLSLSRSLIVSILICVISSAAAGAPEGLLAEWNFDEGRGDVARDSSGRGHDAKLYGARWARQGDGFVLSLDGKDDYADCGKSRDIGITGPVTIEAWIKPTRKAHGLAALLGEGLNSYGLFYYNTETCNWYIGSGANGLKQNHLIVGQWNHVVATFDGDMSRMWLNGRLSGRMKSKVKTYKPGGRFLIATRGRPDLPHFKGMLDSVRVYGRALSGEEATAHFKEEAAGYGFDPTWFKRVKVTPYYYMDRGKILVEVDFKGLEPLQGKAQIEVTLSGKERPNEPIQRQVIDKLPKDGVVDVALAGGELADGDYVIRVKLQDEKGPRPVEELAFSLPRKPLPVVSPAEKTVAPLPAKPEPTPFDVTIGNGGGFQLTVKGVRYDVRSRISWPNGDFNRFTPGDKPYGKGEKSWRVKIAQAAKNRYEVTAGGDSYTIQREVGVYPTHVYVRDKYTNTTDKDLGLLIYNEVPVKPDQVVKSFVSGHEMFGRQKVMSYPDYAPSIFFTDANTGMGMIPIDDVFVIQAVPYVEWENAAGVGTEKFALGPGKSYTLEWAVYPTGSGDYYDFINTFRKVENRIGTVEGAPGFISWGPMNRRQVPDDDFFEKRGTKIGIVSVLGRIADDPQVSVNGLGFMDFPREMELLAGQAGAFHKKYPGLKIVFHVAHSLYLTNDPDRFFPDSRVILANGKQTVWTAAPPYVSKERGAEGWTWYVYYPTPGNSFHARLMKSVDVMMDQMGFDGAFMDGFFAGYVSQWSYDTDLRWDGHSAVIDRRTKTIKRKVNSVLLLSQPSMIAFARKIRDKGGVVIGNSAVFTRSICNEKYIIYDSECASGPALHVAPSVTALAAPPFNTDKDIYLDMLDKLSWGMLFLYYNERIDLEYASLAAREFPMTFEEIRSGLVRGKERIVTMNSGVYGWPADRSLHQVFKFDDRGAPTSHDYITTVDSASVRTELKFRKNESAVIEPIPVTLEASAPVNVRVLQYDDAAFRVLLNGKGQATLDVFVGTSYPDRRDGVFTDGGVNPADVGVGAAYRVTAGGVRTTIAERDGTLKVPLRLDGQVEVVIERAD